MESLDIQYSEKESFFFKKSKHFQRGKEFSSYVQSKEKKQGVVIISVCKLSWNEKKKHSTFQHFVYYVVYIVIFLLILIFTQY